MIRRSILLASFALLTLSARADSTLVFNEIMYHPTGDETLGEWLELHNQMTVDLDISGWTIGNGVFFQFPAGTIVPGGGIIVVAASPATLAAAGVGGAFGPFTGRLDNDGERLELLNHSGWVMDSVRYNDDGDWPVAPDGSGATLAKVDPDAGSAWRESWTESAQIGGTPGAANFPATGGGPSAPQGIVSWWSFDETGDTARDAFGGNAGSLGSTTARVAGLVGSGALRFDNTANGFVNVGAGIADNFSVRNGLTIEAVVVVAWSGASGDHEMIFRKEDGGNRIVLGFQNDGNQDGRSLPALPGYDGPVLSFGINAGGVYSELDMPLDGQSGRPALAALADGRAHHIAATYDSDTGRKAIAIDGVAVYSTTLGGGDRVTSGGASSAYIGNMSGRSQPFTGTIDEVAFWSRALSAAEIAAHAAATAIGQDYFSTPSETGPRPPLSFNEYSFAAANDYWIELANHGATPMALGGLVVASGNLASQRVLATESLPPGGFRVLTRAELGFDLSSDARVFLYSAGRAALIDALALREPAEARFPDATGPWLVPAAPSPGAANSVAIRDDIVINEILYHQRPEQATPPELTETQLLPIDAVWKYEASGADLGTAWRQLGFDDGAWPSGAGLIYNETADLPGPKNTEVPLGVVTYYFRIRFDFQGDPETSRLIVRPIIDDGAVFYLNGAEAYRLNIPGGAVTAATLANPGVGNAAFSAPVAFDAVSLRRGTNVLAVEVHQATANSTDIVFGLEASTAVVLSEGHPYRESPESWIEILNRGAATVDLTGWRVTGGIDYAFESGAVIAPGEHLVIAGDRQFLGVKYPAIRIAGEFTGRLSNAGDRIVLRDARGNPADEVRYYDSGRWPENADGGGSSLELVDPRADNSKAEAWAASDESEKAPWRSYSYRAVATANFGPTQWRELVLGILDAGEALIDDLSVVESPGGAAVELLQNGDFQSGATSWRILGNHRHSRVIVDPDNAANRVLHLVAVGPTEHMHNHLETTLANNASVVNGREYEISFRARWLAGSNQLNTRLYFNRVPRTTLLETVERTGTPGARNSRYAANAGPTFAELRHEPVVPSAGEEVTVTIHASDPDGVGSATLWYSLDGAAAQSRPMTASGTSAEGTRYAGTVPGQSSGRIVQFWVDAADTRGARATYPAAGPDSRALYKVEDGQASPGPLANFRIIMTTADANLLHLDTNVMSNERLGGTVVSKEREVFYDVGVRLKGSQRGRLGGSRVSFSVRFHPDRPYRGVHESVSLDRSGGWGIGAGPTGQDEIIVKHIMTSAGGLPGMYDDLGWLVAPRSAQNGPTLVMMAKYTDVFLDAYVPNGGDGSQYKVELIYYPTTTQGGTQEGLKLPQPDNVIGTDLRDLGDDKEAYRWTFLLENNAARDDYDGFIRLAKVLGSSGAAFDAAIDDVLDADEAARMYVVHSLCGVGDTYWYAGNHHNMIVWENPVDRRFQVFGWDNDFAWNRGTSESLWGGVNLAKIFSLPRHNRAFYLHLKDILDSTYNLGYMTRWTQHYGALAQETGSFNNVRNYIGARAAFATNQLPARVAFAVTTNNGADFTVGTLSTTIEGRGWIDVQTILLADPDKDPLVVQWLGADRWSTEVPLFTGDNDLTFLAFDPNGELVASDSLVVRSTATLPQAVIDTVTPAQAAPGETVTITGTGFQEGLAVYFGDTRAIDVEFDPIADATRIAVLVPDDLAAGPQPIGVRNADGRFSERAGFSVVGAPGRFIRGDANASGLADLSDAVRILLYLFGGRPIDCLDAADVDDDESIGVTDAIRLLDYLFKSGPPPAPPFPAPGADATGNGALDCGS